jgi:hypothetical protein
MCQRKCCQPPIQMRQIAVQIKGCKMPFLDGPCLTAALTDITAARVNYPAATGIDYLKTAAVIGDTPIAALLFFLAARFTDIGFLVGHDVASLMCITSPEYRDAWLFGSSRANRWWPLVDDRARSSETDRLNPICQKNNHQMATCHTILIITMNLFKARFNAPYDNSDLHQAHMHTNRKRPLTLQRCNGHPPGSQRTAWF